MSAPALPHTISLSPSTWTLWAELIGRHWRDLRLRWREHSEWRAAMAAQRQLAQLDARTLRDIGAAEGLIGQRRWQEEQGERLRYDAPDVGRW